MDGILCKIINPSNPQIFNINSFFTSITTTTTTKLPRHLRSYRTSPNNYSLISANSSSSTTQTQTTPEPKSGPSSFSKVVKFKTLGSCKLGIARYPDFSYNADGGKGTGRATVAAQKKNSDDADEDEIWVSFDVGTLYIPALSSETTKLLGLPLPPFLKIEIVPELFQGVIIQQSGKVDLEFKAKFCFSVGSIYKAPPLIVKTVLTSEESIGAIRRGRGQRLNEDGICRLVGVATVDPIDDFFMNSFLGLPTECLADLSASISLES